MNQYRNPEYTEKTNEVSRKYRNQELISIEEKKQDNAKEVSER